MDPDCLRTLLYLAARKKLQSVEFVCELFIKRGIFTSFFSLHNRRLPKKPHNFFRQITTGSIFLCHWLTAQFHEKNKLSKARQFAESAKLSKARQQFAESADIFAGQRSGSKEAQSAI